MFHVCVLWCAVAIMVTSCQRQDAISKPQRVTLPEGGIVQASAMVPGGKGVVPLVLSEQRVFSYVSGGWSQLWVGDSAEQRSFPSASSEQLTWRACTGQREGNFVSYNKRLWLVTQGVLQSTSKLWSISSGDGGWREEILPLALQGRAPRLSASGGQVQGASVCVFEQHNQLFVMAEDRIWQREEPSDSAGAVEPGWQEISLQGVDGLRWTLSEQVPRVLRHYYPATENHPYELLTVLGEQLHVYRRDARHSRWVLVSVLPFVDVDLWREESTGRVLSLTADSVYQSDDYERWDRTRVLEDESSDEEFTALKVIPVEGGQSDTAMVFAGTSYGRIFRSMDGGRSFSLVRKQDRDQRGITSFEAMRGEDDTLRLWAFTHGQGVLRGENQGQQWQLENQGLDASVVTDMELYQGEVWVGTPSGLYREDGIGVPGSLVQQSWSQVLSRGVTAMHMLSDQVLVGTQGGGLIAVGLARSEQSFQELVEQVSERENPFIFPGNSVAYGQRDMSVVDLVFREGTQQVGALTLHHGVWWSSDNASSWRYEPQQDSFVQALQGQRITQWLLPPSGSVSYVQSRGLEFEERVRLWSRASDDEAWKNVYTYSAREGFAYFFAMSSEHLVRVDLSGVYVSEDGGGSWSDSIMELGERIYSINEQGGWLVVLGTVQDQAFLMRFKPEKGKPSQDWSREQVWLDSNVPQFELNDVQEVLWADAYVNIRTSTYLWRAPRYQKPVDQSRSVFVLLSVFVSMILVSVSFGLTRIFRSR